MNQSGFLLGTVEQVSDFLSNKTAFSNWGLAIEQNKALSIRAVRIPIPLDKMLVKNRKLINEAKKKAYFVYSFWQHFNLRLVKIKFVR